MGNYVRPQDNPDYIQADIAYRLGRVLTQYSNTLLPARERFDATLSISILQTLLTQCVELINTLKSNRQKKEHHFLLDCVEEKNYFLLNSNQISVDTFGEKLTVDRFLRHLRNALSHPNAVNLSTQFPETGYTPSEATKEAIQSFAFVSSPDVRRSRPKSFKSEGDASSYIERAKQVNPNCSIAYSVANGRIELVNPRIFYVKLQVSEIKHLALKLCTYLSQPIQEQWLEQPYNENILAA